MKCHRVLIFLFVAAGVAICSPTAWPQGRSSRLRPPIIEIHGQVRYAQGPGAPLGVMVVLESIRGGVVSQAQTDSQGKFAFPQIDQDVYIVTVRHPGYRETSERIDLTMVPTANVIIDLQPLPREGPPPRPGGEAGFPVTAEELAAPEEAKTEFEKGRKLLFEDKQPGESIPHFQKAIKMHSPYASAYAFLGVAQMDLHKWKDAETALGKAI